VLHSELKLSLIFKYQPQALTQG